MTSTLQFFGLNVELYRNGIAQISPSQSSLDRRIVLVKTEPTLRTVLITLKIKPLSVNDSEMQTLHLPAHVICPDVMSQVTKIDWVVDRECIGLAIGYGDLKMRQLSVNEKAAFREYGTQLIEASVRSGSHSAKLSTKLKKNDKPKSEIVPSRSLERLLQRL